MTFLLDTIDSASNTQDKIDKNQRHAGNPMKPFNREKFLLFMLAGIFIWQAAIFSYGVIGCFQIGGKAACPELGDRYEATVNVMVATTLALLGAGAVASATQRPRSSDDDRDASASQLPLQLQQPSQESSSEALPQARHREQTPGRGGRKA